jgi:hypothetical protein
MENIINEIIKTDNVLKPIALQFSNDFKNNLPKLMDIHIKDIKMDTYISYLNDDEI